MSKVKTSKRDLYYTARHEWIDFQGSVAYVGAGILKLKKMPGVQQLLFAENAGFTRQGEIILRIESESSTISVHMPVDGKIININEILVSGNHQLLIEQPESNGWVALIVPTRPYERTGLMQAEQYRQFVKQNSH